MLQKLSSVPCILPLVRLGYLADAENPAGWALPSLECLRCETK